MIRAVGYVGNVLRQNIPEPLLCMYQVQKCAGILWKKNTLRFHYLENSSSRSLDLVDERWKLGGRSVVNPLTTILISTGSISFAHLFIDISLTLLSFFFSVSHIYTYASLVSSRILYHWVLPLLSCREQHRAGRWGKEMKIYVPIFREISRQHNSSFKIFVYCWWKILYLPGWDSNPQLSVSKPNVHYSTPKLILAT